jgi:3-oxoacyl-[acyl-carrier-protein] synthase-3
MTKPEPHKLSKSRLREIVEECLRREFPAGMELPPAEEDLLESGRADSMAWVGILSAIESAAGVRGLAEAMEGRPSSRAALLDALASAFKKEKRSALRTGYEPRAWTALFAGWSGTVGSDHVTAGELESEFGLPAGKIRRRAGIESVARAATNEDEVAMGVRAAVAALARAGADIGGVDWLLATSETYLGFPSLAAALSAQLLVNVNCGVLDVGGGCAGLLSCLAVAGAMIESGGARQILVVTSDCHSRILRPGAVKGEFGALFGDGASAFVLRAAGAPEDAAAFRLAPVRMGCTAAQAIALELRRGDRGQLHLRFRGEALAHAAVDRLAEIVEDLELRSGVRRTAAAGFAIHQPNSRVVELLARKAELPREKIPDVSLRHGNLGSSTCGLALASLLETYTSSSAETRGPIFAAAVAPGMIWGGTYLY